MTEEEKKKLRAILEDLDRLIFSLIGIREKLASIVSKD
jgi:hypothetical protein